MNVRRCTALRCGRPYQVNKFSVNAPFAAYRGKITCPHCGAVELDDSDSIFLTHALSREEENSYGRPQDSPQDSPEHGRRRIT